MEGMSVSASFDATRPQLLRVAHRMLESFADAKDVLQEEWLRGDAEREAVCVPEAWQRFKVVKKDSLCRPPAELRTCQALVDAHVDRDVRGWEKTSDHAPVWIELSDQPERKRRT